MIAGNFTAVGGVVRNGLARLNVDGSLDLGFNPNVAGGTVNAIALQADGAILIGGGFTSVDGASSLRIARLDVAGDLDLSFSSDVNDNTVNSIALQSDGGIVIGGGFSSIGQFVRSRIARLETDGTLDLTYRPFIDGTVHSVVVQDDGKVIAAGSFVYAGDSTITRRGIARFNTNGNLNTDFNAELSQAAFDVALQADGKVLVVGSFVNVGGVTRRRMARLNEDGSLEQLIPDDEMCLPIIAKSAKVALICL